MLALQSYEQQNGFSVITADELYYVNGGSFSCGTAGIVFGAVGFVAGVAATIVTGGTAAPTVVGTWLAAGATGCEASAIYCGIMEKITSK